MRLLLVISIVLTSFITVHTFGQSRDITESELKKLIVDAAEKRKGLPYREKVTTTGYGSKNSSESVYEFGPNDTYHYMSVRKINGAETRTEGIRIGDTIYKREQDGTWIKQIPQSGSAYGDGNGSGSGPGSDNRSNNPPEIASQYMFVGSEKIRGQSTSHYRKSEIIKFHSQPTPLTRTVLGDYWINADGLLVKEILEDKFDDQERRYKSETEYEYDKDIKITAPIQD